MQENNRNVQATVTLQTRA